MYLHDAAIEILPKNAYLNEKIVPNYFRDCTVGPIGQKALNKPLLPTCIFQQI
jgi:hypothetical protein